MRDDVNADLVDELVGWLAEHGNVRVTLTDLADMGVSVAGWRRAARAAGRRLRRPLRTLQHDGGAMAYLSDWPATTTEEQRQRQRLGAAVAALTHAT